MVRLALSYSEYFLKEEPPEGIPLPKVRPGEQCDFRLLLLENRTVWELGATWNEPKRLWWL